MSLVRPPSDLDVVVARSTVSHLLSLDMLSLITSKKDAFCVALILLESTSQMLKAKAFISKVLAETSHIFSSMDL